MKCVRLAVIACLAVGSWACNDGDILSTPTPTTSNPPQTEPDPGNDIDGDGIPDDQDNLPCLAVYLRVANQDVSSAEILVNDEIVMEASSFPTTEIITRFINANQGINVLALGGDLNGSPGDILHFLIADTTGVIYLEETFVRQNGSPVGVSYEFTIDAEC